MRTILPTASRVFVWLWIIGSRWTTRALSLANSHGPSRRDFVNTALIGASGLLAEPSDPKAAWAAPANLPFCVIGANGKTGTKCVQDILSRGMAVRATSRSGVYDDAESSSSSLLVPTVCDVTLPSTVDAAVKGARAVIFAASASKQGGTPSQVDNVGLVNVAESCIKYKVPHLVIVSSGGVSKPDSPVYKFLNVFGGIMAEKIKGEDAVRAAYARLGGEGAGGPTYTVVRPGGLTEEPPRGVAEVELNQGDAKSGRISRYDVARLCVEATMYPALTGATTFECYDADTGKDLGSVGLSNIMKQTSKPSEVLSGKERRGESYQALFSGLEKDRVG